MLQYKNKEALILEISTRANLFIAEFDNIVEKDKNKPVEGVDKTPTQMIAYQLGWMNLILDWEKEEENGNVVQMPTKDYRWNNLGGLYINFYEEYSEYSLQELRELFIETEEKIIKLVNSYTDVELFEQGRRQWASSTPSNWPVWKWIHINTVAPFKSFRTKIRKWKKLNQIK